jgi:hypothetical protein
MPSVTVRNEHKAYLERTARALTERSGTRVTTTDVLQSILDLCIRDEGMYETRLSVPVQPDKRDIYVAERDARTRSLSIEELLLSIGYSG